MSNKFAAFLGLASGVLITLAVVGAVLLVLAIVATWKIFTKAGEKGWKSLIPFYNLYILFKICWNKNFFWIALIVGVAYAVFKNFAHHETNLISNIIVLVFLAFMIVLYIILAYRLCRSFGHGGGWTFGLIILPTIFTLMLGLGKSEYKGNVYLEEKNKK